jgi:nitrate/TMAO reductase-like tetraheme cytochrome c subunit
MEYTNTLEICISCHEMRDTVYVAHKESIHYRNPSGVRLICSDCHVPKDWTVKLIRKIKATNELYHKLLGTIDTKEKFEQHRLEMAERVWAEVTANNSRECRNCHDYGAMDFGNQGHRAREKMEPATEKGVKTEADLAAVTRTMMKTLIGFFWETVYSNRQAGLMESAN